MSRRRALIAAQDIGQKINGNALTWQVGNYNAVGTYSSSTTTYICTSDYVEVQDAKIDYTGPIEDTNNVLYACHVLMYDSDHNFLGRVGLTDGSGGLTAFEVSAFCRYVRFNFGHTASSGTTMSASDGQYFSALASKVPAHTITWLYNNGTISDILSGFNNDGYAKYESSFSATQDTEYLRIYTSSTSSSYKGGKTFTATNQLPQSFVGKTMYAKGEHKNSDSSASDYARVYVSDSVASSTELTSAFVNSISVSGNLKTDAALNDWGLLLRLTKVGYFSLVGQKNGSGATDIRFKEVWVE